MTDTYCLLLCAVPAADADREAALERLRALGEVEALGVLRDLDPPRIGATLTSPSIPSRETLAALSQVTGDVWACAYHATSDAAAIGHARGGEVVAHDPRRHIDDTEEPCAWMTTEALKGARGSTDLRAAIERADPERQGRAAAIAQATAERDRQRAHDRKLMQVVAAAFIALLVAYVGWWLFH